MLVRYVTQYTGHKGLKLVKTIIGKNVGKRPVSGQCILKNSMSQNLGMFSESLREMSFLQREA